MKKILLYITLVSLILVSDGCLKGFLDTPAPYVSNDVYFSSDDAAVSAIAGAYDPIGWYFYMQFYEWAIGDIASDDAEKGGENEADQLAVYKIATFQATAENEVLRVRWQVPYIGIHRANSVIEGLTDNDKITPALRDRIIGEAKFLRSFYYFQLVRDFGGVPLVLSVVPPSQYRMPRSPIDSVYMQIEKDLTDAMAVLPKKSEMPADELGRATWGAAAALLVKTYVYWASYIEQGYIEQGDANAIWQKAYDLATEIVNSGEYDLDPDYWTNFTLDGENDQESVFEIQYATTNPGQWGDANEGQVTSIFRMSRQNGGWGFDCPTQDLVDEFENNDPRRDYTILDNNEVMWAGTPDETEFITVYAENPTGYHSQKYLIPPSQRGPMSDDPLNWKYIRFSEVLLWQAEAAAHIGQDWQTPLNRVRARVGMPDVNPADFASPLDAIYHERRVELALEGHRYYDLIRTGQAEAKLGPKGWTKNKAFLPIPQVEINLNNNLTQNPYNE